MFSLQKFEELPDGRWHTLYQVKINGRQVQDEQVFPDEDSAQAYIYWCKLQQLIYALETTLQMSRGAWLEALSRIPEGSKAAKDCERAGTEIIQVNDTLGMVIGCWSSHFFYLPDKYYFECMELLQRRVSPGLHLILPPASCQERTTLARMTDAIDDFINKEIRKNRPNEPTRREVA